MCGRVALPKTEVIVKELGLKYEGEQFPAHINIPPTLQVPLITNTKPDTLQYFTWSLIPSFSKTGKADFKMSTFNATIERLEESNLWKPLLGKRHCVVITDGFYEWQYDDPIKKKGSHPHLIKAKNSRFTYMAGLWSAWANKETGELIPSCTIITLPANTLMAEIHNTKGRMPAFLTTETVKVWLDPELSYQESKNALSPVPDEFLDAYPLKKVGDEEEYLELMKIC
ncbi:SOS response-associated peptidase [Daejeonella oryzae]|uniref:SOS response-associated peptidase n=1 Tax=Daejeonella oryzae TaxID=1122943 RepID=UPI0004238590|nr:SOS response-associated peptidase [Daejeonella oryzae]